MVLNFKFEQSLLGNDRFSISLRSLSQKLKPRIVIIH